MKYLIRYTSDTDMRYDKIKIVGILTVVQFPLYAMHVFLCL